MISMFGCPVIPAHIPPTSSAMTSWSGENMHLLLNRELILAQELYALHAIETRNMQMNSIYCALARLRSVEMCDCVKIA